ncbi:MAG: nucleotidyl transferase AbiEii/AbiGii toxin family protein [bacterium]
MMIELLDKSTLLLKNKKFKYPLAIAEKDYFLAIVSKIVYDSHLKEKIVFKGGTAIHHCYLDQFRFSEDLDFGSLDKTIAIDEVKSVLEKHDFLKIKKEYVSSATIKLEKVQYIGPLELANSLKLEIDFLQNIVLPPLDLEYKNIWGVRTKARVMDIKEIVAEKIRAMNDRIRYRDFYDFTMILLKFKIDLKEILQLVKKKEVRKNISPNNILNNWKIAKEDKINESLAIYFTEELSDEQIMNELQRLNFVEINTNDKNK